jgi:hypothetical protein
LKVSLALVSLALAAAPAPSPTLSGRHALPIPPQFDVVQANLTSMWAHGPLTDIGVLSFDMKNQRYGYSDGQGTSTVFGGCTFVDPMSVDGEILVCTKNATVDASGAATCGNAAPNAFRTSFDVVTRIAPVVAFQAWFTPNFTWQASTERGCFETQFDVGIGLDDAIACLHTNGLPTFLSVQDSMWFNVSVSTAFASPSKSIVSLSPIDNC